MGRPRKIGRPQVVFPSRKIARMCKEDGCYNKSLLASYCGMALCEYHTESMRKWIDSFSWVRKLQN